MNVFYGTLMLSVIFSSGVSNIRHGGQDSPEEDSMDNDRKCERVYQF